MVVFTLPDVQSITPSEVVALLHPHAGSPAVATTAGTAETDTACSSAALDTDAQAQAEVQASSPAQAPSPGSATATTSTATTAPAMFLAGYTLTLPRQFLHNRTAPDEGHHLSLTLQLFPHGHAEGSGAPTTQVSLWNTTVTQRPHCLRTTYYNALHPTLGIRRCMRQVRNRIRDVAHDVTRDRGVWTAGILRLLNHAEKHSPGFFPDQDPPDTGEGDDSLGGGGGELSPSEQRIAQRREARLRAYRAQRAAQHEAAVWLGMRKLVDACSYSPRPTSRTGNTAGKATTTLSATAISEQYTGALPTAEQVRRRNRQIRRRQVRRAAREEEAVWSGMLEMMSIYD